MKIRTNKTRLKIK